MNPSKFFRWIFTAAFVFLLIFSAQAQDNSRSLEETLQMLSQDAAASYLNPISSAFGAYLNAGWFHRAPKAKKLGFDLEFGLIAMGAYFDDASKHFSTSGRFRFRQDEAAALTDNMELPSDVQQALINEIISHDYTVGISGATIVGNSDDSLHIAFQGQSVTFTSPTTGQDTMVTVGAQNIILPIAGFGDLANVKMLPLLAPQLSIGTIFGTQATLRYLPSTQLSADLGALDFFGFGFQHNPAIWLPFPVPVDIAASFYTQKLTVGDLFETTATAFGINVSKEIGAVGLNITPYAGFMMENSSMRVRYNYLVDTPLGPSSQSVDFKIEGENKTRTTLGLSIRFLLINLNADYNIGKYNSASAGLTLRF